MMFDMLLIWAKYRHAILYSSKKTQKKEWNGIFQHAAHLSKSQANWKNLVFFAKKHIKRTIR